MTKTQAISAVEQYALRVDAVLAQRTRLRGPQPPGDLFAGLSPDHPLIKADPRRPHDQNLAAIAAYIEPDDVIVDVGGGAGRMSLPLALRCREVINVDPSSAMGAGFKANASAAGIANTSVIQADWLAIDPPVGTVALVNHVTYLTRDIVPFVRKLERAGARRVVISVNSPPPPSWNRVLFQLVHGEEEAIVPGHVELANVLWELGILPDIRALPLPSARPVVPAPSREAAIDQAVARFNGDQWSNWPLGPELEGRIRRVLEARYDELFAAGRDGIVPRYITPGREILITWQPSAGSGRG
jgi:SAM-dependent methyltransferase